MTLLTMPGPQSSDMRHMQQMVSALPWHQLPCWQTILAQYWPNIDILGPDWPTLQYWANVGAILWCQCNGVAILANVGAILNNNKQWQNSNANDLGTKVLQVC